MPRPADIGPHLLRLSLGLIFFFFGYLKFFPDLSPAEMLASQTIFRSSWGWIDAKTAMFGLAIFECAIGLGFLLNIQIRIVTAAFLLHMLGTFLPLILLPELAFQIAPFAPTLEGEFIFKNIVFIAAGVTVLLHQSAGQDLVSQRVPETEVEIESPLTSSINSGT